MSTFNQAQKILIENYGSGDFIGLLPGQQSEVGDTLFEFLVNELADSEDCKDLEEAKRRLNSAIADINNVYSAIEKFEAEASKAAPAKKATGPSL